MGQIYLIPCKEQIKESQSLAQQYGAAFEYNDFIAPQVLDDEEATNERIQFYEGLKRDRSHDTLHGAFLDVTIHSEDARIREVSEYRVRQSLQIATRLGVRAVIFHTNYLSNFRNTSYQDNWVKKNKEFFTRMLEEYTSLEIYIENMFDEEPELLYRLAKVMQHPRFGVCLDYAHLAISSASAQAWVKKLAPYVRHIHMNDNDLYQDLHEVVGAGKIDWQEYERMMVEYKVDASVLIEVKGLEQQCESLRFMKEQAIYPFGEERQCLNNKN